MSLLLNGIIVSGPWQNRQEYEIIWDTSGLPFSLEKSKIHHSLVKSDNIRLAQLKMAHFTFDQLHPDGLKGIVNVGWSRPRTTTGKDLKQTEKQS